MASSTDSRPESHVEQPAADIEKQQVLHKEHSHVVDDDKTIAPAVDYSGATAKTDPEEIKLVKKLDLWVMVSQIVPKHINLKSNKSTADSLADVLAEVNQPLPPFHVCR